MNGETMLSWMKDLFPINRPLSGDGNRETLGYLKNLIPEMKVDYFACGENVFDWAVPDEWNVIENWFTPNQHFIYWHNLEDLYYKIYHIVNNHNMYTPIVHAAYEKVQEYEIN